jgi:serine protease Do
MRGPLRAIALGAGLGLLLGAGAARAGDPFLRRTAAVQVVERAGPAVVNITTQEVVQPPGPRGSFGDPFFDAFFRDFFEPRMPRTLQNLGSGVLIDPRGTILTNEHVVGRASRIRVSLADGREFDAELVGADPNHDIAVLRALASEELPWLPLGSSSDLMVGEPVIAIGNPFGLSNTVTTGVISALDRSIRTERRTFHGFLQTDASINPGNSGGPLLDAEGELVGINTAVYQGGQGIGFAIPIDAAKRVVRELIEHGEVQPVWLGLDFQDLTPALREALRVPEGLSGAVVSRVEEGSPARRAGLRAGDLVSHLDERPVESARGFFERLESATRGQVLHLSVWREGKKLAFQVPAEEFPAERVAALVEQLLGLTLERGPAGGFLVRSVRAGSGAHRIGIQSGDLLLGINGVALESQEALRRQVLDLRGRSRASIVVQRGAGRYHVTIPLV